MLICTMAAIERLVVEDVAMTQTSSSDQCEADPAGPVVSSRESGLSVSHHFVAISRH